MSKRDNKTRGASTVYLHLTDMYDIGEDKGVVIKALKLLEEGDVYTYKNTTIKKIAPNKFEVDKVIVGH